LRDVLNIGIMTLEILDAVVSVIGELTDGTTLEVATIGNEGLVGLPQFLQATTMLFTAFVQIPGAALRMDAEAFGRTVRAIGSDFHAMLARYTHVWCNQLFRSPLLIGNWKASVCKP
jgi:hypothetical protein